MEYIWIKATSPQMPLLELWQGMLLSAGLTTLPELFFAYYLMYIGYERLANQKGVFILNILQLAIVLAICVGLVRVSGHYILNNWAYDKKFAEKILWDSAVLWRSLIYFGFSSGLALSLKLFRKQITAAKREKALVEEKLGVELKLLRNQLHPHFLFNTLNNIYSLTRKKSDLAPEAVLKLSDLLDFMLYKSEADTLPLTNEIQFLEDYVSLEKIRYNERLSINFRKNIDDPSAQIAPLLLLPLVENAFKHGASEARADIFIDIEIVQKNEDLFFTVKNTYDLVTSGNVNGNIGLKNVSRRLELLYKDHTIEVKSEDALFYVSLYLNLESYGKT